MKSVTVERLRRLRTWSLRVFLLGLFMFIGLYSEPYFNRNSASPAPPELPSGSSSADIITAITGLVTALGGACGGVAGLLLAWHTVQRQRRGDGEPPATPSVDQSTSEP